MNERALLAQLAPTGLACARLLPLAIWWTRASSGFLPGAVAWSSVLALAYFFADPRVVVAQESALWLQALRELGIGVITCFVLAAPFVALRFVLAALGRAIGGPLGERAPAVFGLGTCALLMQLAVHRALVRALAEGFVIVPLGRAGVEPSELAWALFVVFGHAASLCLTLLMPWLCALLMIDLAVAFGARWLGAEGSAAHLPVRVSALALGLGSAWLAFAERVPALLREGFAQLRPVLERVTP